MNAGCSRCFTPVVSTTSTSSSLMSSLAKGSSTRTRRQSLLSQTERQTERTQDEADITSTSAILATKDMGVQTDLPTAQIPFPFPGLPPPTVHLSQTPGSAATVRLPGNVQVSRGLSPTLWSFLLTRPVLCLVIDLKKENIIYVFISKVCFPLYCLT